MMDRLKDSKWKKGRGLSGTISLIAFDVAARRDKTSMEEMG